MALRASGHDSRFLELCRSGRLTNLSHCSTSILAERIVRTPLCSTACSITVRKFGPRAVIEPYNLAFDSYVGCHYCLVSSLVIEFPWVKYNMQ